VNVISNIDINRSVSLSDIRTFLSIFMHSAGDGWMVFDPKYQPNLTPTLLHYNGIQWSTIQVPTVNNTSAYCLSGIFITSPTDDSVVYHSPTNGEERIHY
jgi:hypothetical protein